MCSENIFSICIFPYLEKNFLTLKKEKRERILKQTSYPGTVENVTEGLNPLPQVQIIFMKCDETPKFK